MGARWVCPNFPDSNSHRCRYAIVFLNHRLRKIEAGTKPGGGIKPPIGRSGLNSAQRRNFSINPVVVRSAVKVRQGIDARGDQLWLDASARDALGFAVMARVRTERPMPSAAAALTPPLVHEANHAERNDAAAISEMMPEVYEDLRRLAETFLRGERTAHTLQRTALVHEAFLRLIGEKDLVWQNRSHFIGIFARVMRQTLTNYAVARHRLKRGGSDPLRLTLEFYDSRKIDVTALDQALQALETLDERQARIVELRFFGGLTVEETAELLEISPATVKRDWTLAKIWLRRELSAN
jgi:RNA polymerase sigma-70 factor, ECF subfamily